MQKYLFISILSLVLAGCSSQPKQVKASRPLVENIIPSDYQVIPEQYWSILSDSNSHQLEHGNIIVRLGGDFFSGLGKSCRTLHIKESRVKSEQNRIACYNEEDKSWYLTPAIITKDETEVFSQ